MSKEKADKKTVVMSFAVTEEMAAKIRQIPAHTTWIRDLVSENLCVCPTCRQEIKTKPEGATHGTTR